MRRLQKTIPERAIQKAGSMYKLAQETNLDYKTIWSWGNVGTRPKPSTIKLLELYLEREEK